MRKILFQFNDKAIELLAECSTITKMVDQKDFGLIEYVKVWLEKSEKLFHDFNMAEQGKVSVIRASLIAAKSGIYTSDAISTQSSKQKKKIHFIIQNLTEASNLLFEAYKSNNEEILKAKTLTNQVVLVALQINHFPSDLLLLPIQPSNLKSIWQFLYANQELQKGLNQVLSIVSFADALRLMDESFTNILQQE